MIVLFQFVHGDDLVTGENAVEQAALLRAGNDQAEMNMEDAERNEHKHQEEMDQPDVLYAHKTRNPAHERSEYRAVAQPVEHHEPGDDLNQHQSVDADIRERGDGVVAYLGNGRWADEGVELHHLDHFLPLLLAQRNHRLPAHPAVAGEKEVEAQEEERDKRHSEGFMHKPEPAHQKRTSSSDPR